MSDLRTELKNSDAMYSSSDQEWVQFIRDHFRIIRSTATNVELDVYQHNSMQYRLSEWLDTELHYPYSVTWIVLLINQLKSEEEFRNLTTILIPEMGVITKLYREFKNLRSQRNNLK